MGCCVGGPKHRHLEQVAVRLEELLVLDVRLLAVRGRCSGMLRVKSSNTSGPLIVSSHAIQLPHGMTPPAQFICVPASTARGLGDVALEVDDHSACRHRAPLAS